MFQLSEKINSDKALSVLSKSKEEYEMRKVMGLMAVLALVASVSVQAADGDSQLIQFKTGEVSFTLLQSDGVTPLAAAEYAVARAGDRPLVLGGDFNIRPRKSELFGELVTRFGFSPPTDPGSIDHLLVRNAEIVEQTKAWPPERRDVPDVDSDLMVRLSDHAPVVTSIRF